MRTQRHFASSDGARLKRGASCEYGILASEDLTGVTADVGPLEIRANSKDTDTREMETGDPDRQRAPPARGQPERGGVTPKWQHALFSQILPEGVGGHNQEMGEENPDQ